MRGNSPDNAISQKIEYQGELSGTVFLALYKDQKIPKYLYDIFVNDLGAENLGRRILSNGTNVSYVFTSANVDGFFPLQSFTVVFYKCNFVGYFTTVGTSDVEPWITYIERLSIRFSNLLECK